MEGEAEIKSRWDTINQKSNLEESFLKTLMDENDIETLKAALNKLAIVQINLNLLNSESCDQFADFLESHNAIIRFCNFTKIHHYDDESKLCLSVPKLLRHPENCLVMYATGFADYLQTNVSMGLASYFKSCLKKSYHAAIQLSAPYQVPRLTVAPNNIMFPIANQNARVQTPFQLAQQSSALAKSFGS